MRSLAHDIQFTLLIKLFLLFLLWFVCFKDTKKHVISTDAWMLGSAHSSNESLPIKSAVASQKPEPHVHSKRKPNKIGDI